MNYKHLEEKVKNIFVSYSFYILILLGKKDLRNGHCSSTVHNV